jgi:hypothetical protein
MNLRPVPLSYRFYACAILLWFRGSWETANCELRTVNRRTLFVTSLRLVRQQRILGCRTVGRKTQLKKGHLQPGLSIQDLTPEGQPARLGWHKTCLL